MKKYLLLILTLLPLQLEAKQPNVLLIIADDLNSDIGAFGSDFVKTPQINKLAANGVVFESAYAQASSCAPSRSSFLTGLYPHQNGVTMNAPHFRDFVPSAVSLPQLFRNNGYYTARVGKVFHYNVPPHIGTDGHDDPKAWDEVRNPKGIDARLNDKVNAVSANKVGATLTWLSVDNSAGEHTDSMLTTDALEILGKAHQTDKPFFLSVGYFRPHAPYIAPKEYFDLYPLDTIKPYMMPPDDRNDIPKAAWADRKGQLDLTELQRKEIIQGYYASISFMDAQVGRLLDGLKAYGLDQNTIVIFLSDHGYHLGAHDLWQKGDLFEGALLTPLIVAEPGRKGNGSNSQSLIELIDIYPTIAKLAGLETAAYVQGKNFSLLLDQPNNVHRDSAYSTMPSRSWHYYPELKHRQITGHTVRTERYRYTEWGYKGNYGAELYDYQEDPQEITNLLHSGAYKTVLIIMQRLLEKRRKEAETPVIEWVSQ